MIAHRNEDDIELYIRDIHGEYPLPDPSEVVPYKHPNGNFPIRIKCAWDSHEVSQLIKRATDPPMHWERARAIMLDMLKNFPADLTEEGTEDPGHIWAISGTPEQIADLFHHFLNDGDPDSRFNRPLRTGPTGSDDDTYDYWPNAMEVAEQLAADLDILYDTDKYRKEIVRVYNELCKAQPDGFGADASEEIWSPSDTWIKEFA